MRFLRIRDFRLMILIPSVSLTLIVLFFAINRSRHYMDQQFQLLEQTIEQEKGKAVKNYIHQLSLRTQRFNYTFSQAEFIRTGFKHFERYGNANKAGDLLKTELKKYYDNAPEEIPYEFQFTLSNHIILYRSNDNSIGRYLEVFETITPEALKLNSPISGFEFGDLTLYLKSVNLISENDKQFGTFETQIPIDDVMDNFVNQMGKRASFYIDIENIPQNSASQVEFLSKWANEKGTMVAIGEALPAIEGKEIYSIVNKNKIKDVWVTHLENRLLEFVTIKGIDDSRIGYWVIEHDMEAITNLHNQVRKLQSFLLPVIFVALSILLFIILSELVTKPIRRLVQRLQQFVEGDFPPTPKIEVSGELRSIHRHIDQLVNRTKQVTIFAGEIGTGKFDTQYKVFGENDQLGIALVEMRDRLLEAEQEAHSRVEIERKERWVADGIAKLSDILRQHSNNVEELNEAVIAFLVNYLDIIQGAVYTLEHSQSEGDYLQLSAAYSYQQKKYMNVKLTIGEGLVGTCAAEKEKIYLENVPDEHIRIVSGLGDAKPAFIFLYPLIMNEQLFGVVELNDFKEVEQYRFDFVEKVSESFAATLANVKINERTNFLLKQYQRQGKELASQEEQMRQNLEQMLISQEEALQKERTVTKLIESIDLSIIRLELSLDAMIISTNQYFLLLIEEISEGVVGRHFESFIEVQSRAIVQKAMQYMTSIKPFHCRIKLMNKFSKEIELVAVFSPIVNEVDELTRIHFLAQKA